MTHAFIGFSFIAAILLGAVAAAVTEAGAPPQQTADCHGAKASCHGEPAKQAGCHGRRTTVAQRVAGRQEARQDSRAERRAARASCHGEKAPKACCAEACDCDCCE